MQVLMTLTKNIQNSRNSKRRYMHKSECYNQVFETQFSVRKQRIPSLSDIYSLGDRCKSDMPLNRIVLKSGWNSGCSLMRCTLRVGGLCVPFRVPYQIFIIYL